MDNSRTAPSVTDELFEPNSNDIKTTVFEDFTALIKIGIINSNVMTTFTGVWLALYYTNQSFVSEVNAVIFALLGTAFIIAGGCTLNNYIDRDIDHIMERTKKRPTVTGKISPRNVLLLGLFFSTFGTILLLQASFMAAILGLFGLFAYVILYTLWTKRHYTINTVVGSISGAVPPLIGWAAIDPNLHPAAWILFLIMFIWQPPHFLALAMKKTKEYRAAGIPMLPVVYGFAMTKRQIVLYIACLLPLPYYLYSLGTIFLVVATLLNIGWLALGLYGFKMKDDLKWARIMFVYSLQYLTIMFILMVIVTIPF